MRVGIDIVKVVRFEKLIDKNSFLEKYFTPQEKEYIFSRPNPAETMAGIYASKEAFLKAVGIGIGGGINLCDIEVLHDHNRRPFIKLTEAINLENFSKDFQNIDISISHTNDTAVAICLIF